MLFHQISSDDGWMSVLSTSVFNITKDPFAFTPQNSAKTW